MNEKEAQQKITELSEILRYHNKRYYVDDSPEIEDFEYDAMMRQLEELEAQFPQFKAPDSPTQMVGGAALKLFSPVEHTVKMESLQDVFSFDELRDFSEKIDMSKTSFSVEPKICLLYTSPSPRDRG